MHDNELKIDTDFFDTQIKFNELSDPKRSLKSTCTHRWIIVSKSITETHYVCTECLKDKIKYE